MGAMAFENHKKFPYPPLNFIPHLITHATQQAATHTVMQKEHTLTTDN